MAPLEQQPRSMLLFLSFAKTRSLLTQDNQVAKADFVLWTLLHLPASPGCWDCNTCASLCLVFCAVMGLKPKASCMLGKYSTG